MTERQSMGPVLRTMGSGPIEVQTDRQDFGVQMFQTPDGKQSAVPAPALITFRAVQCREVEPDSDLWEFRVPEPVNGVTVTALLYWRGVDILSIKAISRVA
jgi:hypothetical protein